ncbi:MAG: LLM class flavin-dependent oxidoreductase, partial [Acidimicrobiales bacterium]
PRGARGGDRRVAVGACRPGRADGARGLNVRVGVMLPVFQPTAERARSIAVAAEAAGLDGVFCFDHVWPLGQPARPAIAPFPVLAHVAGRTTQVALGPLVARVALVPDGVLLAQFDALAVVAPGRVIAGVGTGDRLSAGENEAYGVPFTEAATRREALRECVRALQARGIEVWVGDGTAETRQIAIDEGAVLNLWNATPDEVAEVARAAAVAGRGGVTWAGDASGPLGPLLARLAEAGATWAVLAQPVDAGEVAASRP